MILTIPSSELETLRSFLDYTGGQILKETNTRKRKRAAEGEEEQVDKSAEPTAGNKCINMILY